MMSPPPSFLMFGGEHFLTLFVIGFVTIALPLLVRNLKSEKATRAVATSLALLMLFVKIIEPVVAASSWAELRNSLPLHLCDVGAVLTAVMLLKRNYRLFEITYFWALGGTVQALLTPALQESFPHLHFWFYFVGHGLIMVNVIFAMVLYRFRPTLKSIWRAFLVTVGYAAIIAPVNWLLDANYLYLRQKPLYPSLFDYLGPWPWYLLVLFPVSLLFFFICYAPFLVADLIKKKAFISASSQSVP